MSQKKLSMGQRIFRALLRLLPFDFRWDYGEEMEEVFQEQHKEVQQKGGTMSLMQLWGKTIAGIFATAACPHPQASQRFKKLRMWNLEPHVCGYLGGLMRPGRAC